MGVGIVGGIIVIAMAVPARVNDLAGSQDGAASIIAAIASGRARGAGRQLLAYIVGEGQTATGASIAAIAAGSGADATGAVRFRRRGVAFEEVRVIFDLWSNRFIRDFFDRFWLKSRICCMRGRGDIIGGGRRIGFIGIALRAAERDNLRADDGGRAMHLAEMRQRKLMRCD